MRLITACLCIRALAAAQDADPDLTRYVNPFIGTGQGAPSFGMGNAAGNTPPGAAYPFGMALWSPDTTVQSGGYRYGQNSINGFSLTHFSGRGIGCWQDLPFMPVPGPVGISPGVNRNERKRSEEHTSELQSQSNLVCRLLLEKKKKT